MFVYEATFTCETTFIAKEYINKCEAIFTCETTFIAKEYINKCEAIFTHVRDSEATPLNVASHM